MDAYVKLAYDAIEYYLEKKTYLREFDEKFKGKSNGIRVEVKINERLKGISGSIYPTRAETRRPGLPTISVRDGKHIEN